jgi:hypothetical protein
MTIDQGVGRANTGQHRASTSPSNARKRQETR